MASSAIFFVFSIKLFVYAYLFSLFLIHCSLKGIDAFNETQQIYYTIQLSSLLPSSVCKTASTEAHSRKSSLKVIHRHGPCFQVDGEKPKPPSLKEILHQDRSRVNAIQSGIAGKNSGQRGDIKDSKSVTLPALDGGSLDVLSYVVTVGLGTPKQDFTLLFDTGSHLTWTQCEPCIQPNCYEQKDSKFDPTMSKSYENVSCSSPACNSDISSTGEKLCDSSTCVYTVGYGDQSRTTGFLATETLTLSPGDVFPKFIFGCGKLNQGRFGKIAGLLGLSKHPSSLVFQTAQKYNKLFSYCLPSSPSSTGHLTFGNTDGVNNPVKFTPFYILSQTPSFYGVHLIGLTVGGNKLSIASSVFSNAGAIIDSGTTVTALPPDAYSALRSAVRQMMEQYPLAAASPGGFDTCYDVSVNTAVTVPSVSFLFAGDIEVNIHHSGIFLRDKSQMCLAFAPNENPNEVAVIGNTQQRTLEVVYDVAGGKIGFASGGCE